MKTPAAALAAFGLLITPVRADDLDDANAACMKAVSASAVSARTLQNLQRAAEPGSPLPITANGIERCADVVVRYTQRTRDAATLREAAKGDSK